MSCTDTFDRPALHGELERDEACVLGRVYFDTAKPPRRSAGIGRNLDDVGIRPAECHALGITLAAVLKQGLTRPQALYLCDADIDVAAADLDRELPWWRKLDRVRQRVLLNMCFNMGIGRRKTALRKAAGLLQFVNTLALIEAGQFADAATAMTKSLWHQQVGARAARLEAMMRTGRVPA